MKIEPTLKDDLAHMRAALALAGRGLGRVAPNPAVGCILVRGGHVVGRGWTQPGGRPHAETEAIRRAGDRAKGATAYVTLEPCDHQGETGPCSQALIDAGINRCVIACQDPDRRVSGKGIARLEQAGIDVTFGLLEEEAESLNAGFFLKTTQTRPFYTLKCATSLDGCIATKTGDSQWITSERSKMRGHLLRASHDAILVGIGTALADNPMLDCRLPGLHEQSPIRIILDSMARLLPASYLAQTAAEIPTWVMIGPEADPAKMQALEDLKVRVFHCEVDNKGKISLHHLSQLLARQGVTRVLLEGGGQVAGAFLKENLVDELYWFRAPIVIGGDGLSAIAPFGVEKLENAVGFERVSVITSGPDTLNVFKRVHLV